MDAQTLKNLIKEETLKARALRAAAQVALTQARATNSSREEYRTLHQHVVDRTWKRRQQHLAYGYLRNRRYEQLEAKCTSAGRLYGNQLEDYLKDQGVTQVHLQRWLDGHNITRKQIEADAAVIVSGKEQVA
jgi:hypothetical protein